MKTAEEIQKSITRLREYVSVDLPDQTSDILTVLDALEALLEDVQPIAKDRYNYSDISKLARWRDK